MYENLDKNKQLKRTYDKQTMVSTMMNTNICSRKDDVKIQLKKNNRISNYLEKDVRIIQKQPILPVERQDEDIVRLFREGDIRLIKAVITDERRKEDGAPQQLTMLTYQYEDYEVYIHIHILGAGRYYGHIIWGRERNARRLDLTDEDCDEILERAEMLQQVIEYKNPSQNQRWEIGDYGHEVKGERIG